MIYWLFGQTLFKNQFFSNDMDTHLFGYTLAVIDQFFFGYRFIAKYWLMLFDLVHSLFKFTLLTTKPVFFNVKWNTNNLNCNFLLSSFISIGQFQNYVGVFFFEIHSRDCVHLQITRTLLQIKLKITKNLKAVVVTMMIHSLI